MKRNGGASSNFFLKLGRVLPKMFRRIDLTRFKKSSSRRLNMTPHSFGDVTTKPPSHKMTDQTLSQEEVWDDSALVKSWNEAYQEYLVHIYTSIPVPSFIHNAYLHGR